MMTCLFFFFQAEDGIRDYKVTGVQTCALPISVVLGFPTVTLGVLLGFGVRYAGGAHVDAAQVVWGMLTWLVLGWAVGVRVVRHWVGRRAAFASIASFAAVLLVYLALKLSAPGTQRFL